MTGGVMLRSWLDWVSGATVRQNGDGVPSITPARRHSDRSIRMRLSPTHGNSTTLPDLTPNLVAFSFGGTDADQIAEAFAARGFRPASPRHGEQYRLSRGGRTVLLFGRVAVLSEEALP